MIVINDGYASRARMLNGTGGIISKIPEFGAVGKVKTPKIVAHPIVPVEQIDLAVFDNRAAKAPADADRP
jgi:hypothetical protein